MSSKDKATIDAGKAAWLRIKKGKTLEDWLAIGRALLCGRGICTRMAGTNEPKGARYVKIYGKWLRENGFGDMPNSARNCSMQIAQNEEAVLRWLAAQTPTRRPRVYPQVVWQAYRATIARQEGRPMLRSRLNIDGPTALRARDDVKMAMRDVARRQRYAIAENVLDDFAYAAIISCLNALDVAVPQGLIRKVAFVNGSGRRAPVTRINGNGKIEATAV